MMEVLTNHVQMDAGRGQGPASRGRVFASVWGPQERFLEMVNPELRPKQE